MSKGPRILVADIETAPLLGFVWGLWENNVALNQISTDWHLLSWSAKWLGEAPSKAMYQDQRNVSDITNDKKLLQGIWNLLDEADIVIWQNGKSFDHRKLNARFIHNGMQPPSSYRQIDTKVLAQKHFAFTSHKLEYMTDKLCKKYKKLKHKKFPGFEMWSECLKGNKAAWKEMEKYNKHDVLALEELYFILAPWGTGINFDAYHEAEENVCQCGSKKFKENGHYYTNTAKVSRYRCIKCGHELKSRTNLLSKEKRKSLKAVTNR